jgi:hypothetical protein
MDIRFVAFKEPCILFCRSVGLRFPVGDPTARMKVDTPRGFRRVSNEI